MLGTLIIISDLLYCPVDQQLSTRRAVSVKPTIISMQQLSMICSIAQAFAAVKKRFKGPDCIHNAIIIIGLPLLFLSTVIVIHIIDMITCINLVFFF